MAITRKKTVATPKKRTSKTSDEGVVKRPARGFYRFRNGILNVTPKGVEKELVNTNQESPLLRLPPELRSRIWEYVLAGHTPRSVDVNPGRARIMRMIPSRDKCMHGMDLLRTCRQIYAETALLPYKTNIFSFSPYTNIKHDLKYMKPFQRAQIDKIQIELPHSGGDISYLLSYTLKKDSLEFLPNLKDIHVVCFTYHTVFAANRGMVQQKLEVDEVDVRNRLDVLLAGCYLATTCEIVEESWDAYMDRWHV